jgi:hypothetical protein
MIIAHHVPGRMLIKEIEMNLHVVIVSLQVNKGRGSKEVGTCDIEEAAF